MKAPQNNSDPDMLAEYDFSTGVRGEYAKRYVTGHFGRYTESERGADALGGEVMSTDPEPRPPVSEVPPGILRSQKAFWRDLPELLKLKKRGRWWVAYHGDERVGFGRSQAELYQECFRRGFKSDEVYIGRVEPHAEAPWDEIEIESFGQWPDDDSESPADQFP